MFFEIRFDLTERMGEFIFHVADDHRLTSGRSFLRLTLRFVFGVKTWKNCLEKKVVFVSKTNV